MKVAPVSVNQYHRRASTFLRYARASLLILFLDSLSGIWILLFQAAKKDRKCPFAFSKYSKLQAIVVLI